MESIWAAVAVVITTAGGLYSTVYHGGQVNQQIIELQSRNSQTESRISKHDDELANIQQNQAGMKQSLDDIKDTVHDIQYQVRKPKHGDNQ
jgi:peptidoglycan hydrolase CwlO-like protein